jgi:hypothetical protein
MNFYEPQSEEWIRHKLKPRPPKAPRFVLVGTHGKATVPVKQKKKTTGTTFIFAGHHPSVALHASLMNHMIGKGKGKGISKGKAKK